MDESTSIEYKLHFSVATPNIAATNSAISYEIKGPSVTLTCTSTSGNGSYIWKLDSDVMYVYSHYHLCFKYQHDINVFSAEKEQILQSTLSLIVTLLLQEATLVKLIFQLHWVQIVVLMY